MNDTHTHSVRGHHNTSLLSHIIHSCSHAATQPTCSLESNSATYCCGAFNGASDVSVFQSKCSSCNVSYSTNTNCTTGCRAGDYDVVTINYLGCPARFCVGMRKYTCTQTQTHTLSLSHSHTLSLTHPSLHK